MSSKIVVVFKYDLHDSSLERDFKSILQGLHWIYSDELPSNTCLFVSNEKNEEEAMKQAVNQVKEVIGKIREAGYPEFNVQKYYFLGHKVPASAAFIGSNLYS